MASTTTRPHLTPITLIRHGGQAREATSTDNLWHYRFEEDISGTPWFVDYTPTGQQTGFGSLRAARVWTGQPTAVEFFREQAADVVRNWGRTGAIRIDALHRLVPEDPAECAERTARAYCHLAILDGTMAPAGRTSPDTVCATCGGYLTADGARWVHLDACPECWARPATWTQPCHDGSATHLVCSDPAPTVCDHPSCDRTQDLQAWPCTANRAACCGCCHGED
jgi:hypothetical protein